MLLGICRNSRCSVKRCSLKFITFDNRTPMSESPFNKAATQVNSFEICEIFKNANFEEHLRRAASEFERL